MTGETDVNIEAEIAKLIALRQSSTKTPKRAWVGRVSLRASRRSVRA